MSILPPSHFKDWNPMNKNYFDKLNRNWATDEKFKQLGNCFEKLLLDSARDLNITGLKVHKNRPNTQGGTYLYKRFVRVSPKGFHPNGLQIFIESFSEGTSKDSNTRDLSDTRYNSIGFPIPVGSMGIFIGMSAISKFTGGEKWGMEDNGIDVDVAREFFYEIEEKMEEAREWAQDFTGSKENFIIVQDSRVQRIRIRLLDLNVDSNDWNDCRINEGIDGLLSLFGELFTQHSIK